MALSENDKRLLDELERTWVPTSSPTPAWRPALLILSGRLATLAGLTGPHRRYRCPESLRCPTGVVGYLMSVAAAIEP